MKREELFSNLRTLVIKLGTRVITHDDGRLDEDQINSLVSQISTLKGKGINVIIVSSGAVGAGIAELGLKKRPQDVSGLQACAAVGQGRLIETYARAFNKKRYKVAQILLTSDDLKSRTRFLNARNTIFKLLDEGIVPIVNENDTVTVEEIRFGDNDKLSALVTNLVQAELLIILSNVDGLYDNNKSVIGNVTHINKDIEDLCTDSGCMFGTGGMQTKLEAAKIVSRSGEGLIIANGRKKRVLDDIFKGECLGTFFDPQVKKLTAKKRWLAFFTRPSGNIVVDSGAEAALKERGKSLLASGIKEIKGNFKVGDAVEIIDMNNKGFAAGLSNYNSEELKKIKGLKTSEIQKVLGYKTSDEVIHRNNMTIY